MVQIGVRRAQPNTAATQQGNVKKVNKGKHEMPPSSHLMCCCRNVKKPPLQEGIRRSTEVGTMVLSMVGKFDGMVIEEKMAKETVKVNFTAPNGTNGSIPHTNGISPSDHPLQLQVHQLHNDTTSVTPTSHSPMFHLHEQHQAHTDFATARTSREESQKGQLSMAELIRVVRIEEGLEVTPRIETIEEEREESAREERDREENGYIRDANHNQWKAGSNPQAAAAEAATAATAATATAKRSKPKLAVFNDNGDISARTVTSTSDSARTIVVPIVGEEVMVHKNGQISSISASLQPSTFHTLSHPPQTTSRALVRTVSSVPQTLITVITVAYTWCATWFVMLAHMVWK